MNKSETNRPGPLSENPEEETATAIEGHSAAVVLAFLVGFGVFTYLGVILKPFLTAILLFYWIKPPADWLTARFHLPRWAAYLALFVITCGLCAILGMFVYADSQQFRERFPTYQRKLDSMIRRMGFGADDISGENTSEKSQDPSQSPSDDENHAALDSEANSDTNPEVLGPRPKGPTEALLEELKIGTGEVINYTFGAAMGSIEFATMTFFYLLFLLLSAPHVGPRIRRAFTPNASNRTLEIGEEINHGISQYIKVKTAVSLGMATTAGIIMYLFGVEYWPLWTFLTFAANYITYIGSLGACVPPIVIALVQFDSLWAATAVAVLISLNRLVWIDYIEMRFSGKQLNIDPTLILLSIAYWGVFWGPLGMVLAVPMLTCLKITLMNLPRTRHWAVLISER
ncbi:AI-2E family transporter [Lignipirellula cremea]|uniref:AI-2 transport protein TqsA n=1 Tax=Lignipirellula cremea TaxID=2528010 RepID=A0A518DMD6_9BACT|nr:AI-2E family transporter [Lignipirellula cremea]QDU92981.1 AI-2 transport protein TqsA [Lignipirellula cremea]